MTVNLSPADLLIIAMYGQLLICLGRLILGFKQKKLTVLLRLVQLIFKIFIQMRLGHQLGRSASHMLGLELSLFPHKSMMKTWLLSLELTVLPRTETASLVLVVDPRNNLLVRILSTLQSLLLFLTAASLEDNVFPRYLQFPKLEKL